MMISQALSCVGNYLKNQQQPIRISKMTEPTPAPSHPGGPREIYGKEDGPIILIHGGAGPMDPTDAGINAATRDVIAIAQSCLKRLKNKDPLDPVEEGLIQLENNPKFNAGYGSALQEDGISRLTSAVMDGSKQKFSGVISLSHIRHPSKLARALQTASSRVLTSPGAENLAQDLHLPTENLVTTSRLNQYQNRLNNPSQSVDTVGVAVLNHHGKLASGTSTGGRGFEKPGRVSDSATVAGNYASPVLAAGATGIGEEIVDDALCARLETRRRDGMTLTNASHRCFQEALQRKRSYGWIAVDQKGSWAVCHSTPKMIFAVLNGEGKILASSLTSAGLVASHKPFENKQQPA